MTFLIPLKKQAYDRAHIGTTEPLCRHKRTPMAPVEGTVEGSGKTMKAVLPGGTRWVCSMCRNAWRKAA
jgi:hypothetical protein